MWNAIKTGIKFIVVGYALIIALLIGMMLMTSFMLSALPASP